MKTNAADLKIHFNMSTGFLVFLQFITIGIFPLVWLYRNAKKANEIVGAELVNETFLIAQIIVTILSLLLIWTDYSGFFSFATGVLWIVWAFKARRVLMAYAATLGIDLRMNRFYTIIFTLFYVLYCINDLPVLAERQSNLRAAPV
jgi:hypothetical protein